MNDSKIKAVRQLGRGSRDILASVRYTLAHRIRIEIRAALHEGPATAAELAKIIGVRRDTVDNHLKEMLRDGSIDVARTERVGNIIRRYYSVVELPCFSDEEFAAMSPGDRQILCAIAVQAMTAEAMAALWAGKMAQDPRVMVAWNRINLDPQGREELADEETRSWFRKLEIEAESANRRVETGEPGVTYVVTSLGFARSRTSAPAPLGELPPPGNS